MKKRTSFVTNSSSSSYIVAVKQDLQVDQETINKYPYLEFLPTSLVSIVEAGCDGDSYDDEGSIDARITSKIELDEWFIDRRGWCCDSKKPSLQDIFDEEDYCADYRKQYDEMLDKINNGFIIFDRRVSYHDNGTSALFRKLDEKCGNIFKIIAGDD